MDREKIKKLEGEAFRILLLNTTSNEDLKITKEAARDYGEDSSLYPRRFYKLAIDDVKRHLHH